jgi:hypothetical protein
LYLLYVPQIALWLQETLRRFEVETHP